MCIVNKIVELFVARQLKEIEELAECLTLDEGSPIEVAAMQVKNKPLLQKMVRKRFLIKFMKDV